MLVSNANLLTTPVFVSLPPGSVPGRTSATIRNLQSQVAATVAVSGGGFDPFPLDAIVGDTLETEVQGFGGSHTVRYVMRVPASAPPIVVRTEPSSGKRDVPLNATIIIVFSEPIDPGAITGDGIRVRQGGSAIAGQLRFVDDWHVAVEFVPSVPLPPDAELEFSVTDDIRDLDGDQLAEPVSVTFTTTSVSAVRLVFTSQPGNAMVGSPVTPAVVVALQDAFGDIVTGFDDSISIELAQNPGGSPLLGTTRVAAVQGVATFSDLRLGAAGVGYRLAAHATGAIPATSATFEVGFGGVPSSLSLVPAAIELSPGAVANIRVVDASGQGGLGSLSISGAPPASTGAFGNLSLHRFLELSIGQTTPPGQYQLVVRSTTTTRTDSVILPVKVVADTAGFALSLSSTRLQLYLADTRSVEVAIVRTTESGAVTLGVDTAANALNPTFDPVAPTGSTSTLRLFAGAQASGKLFLATVTGRGAAGSASAQMFVYVPRSTP